MRVYVTLPSIRVTAKGSEHNKEVYVISLASDLHGASNHRPAVVGSVNETLPILTPKITTAMKFFAVAASNIFHDIRPDQPLSLSGDGVVLYPPTDPEGMLALHFCIVESDQGKRDLGAFFAEIFAEKNVKDLLKEIENLTAASGAIPASLLTSLFGTVTTLIPKVLEANKDDILFSHSHSGVDFNGYGGSEEGESYEVANDRAGASLKIWTREQGPPCR